MKHRNSGDWTLSCRELAINEVSSKYFTLLLMTFPPMFDLVFFVAVETLQT